MITFFLLFFVVYDDVGDPIHICNFCSTKFWFAERLPQSRNYLIRIYSKRCLQGKVQLPLLPAVLELLFHLFFDVQSVDSKHFLENSRTYNNMFTFTSMGGRIDKTINDGNGRYSFRLLG